MRFKVGDEVVIVHRGRSSFGMYGDRYVVERIDATLELYQGNGTTFISADDEVELAHVFDSPLYQALS